MHSPAKGGQQQQVGTCFASTGTVTRQRLGQAVLASAIKPLTTAGVQEMHRHRPTMSELYLHSKSVGQQLSVPPAGSGSPIHNHAVGVSKNPHVMAAPARATPPVRLLKSRNSCRRLGSTPGLPQAAGSSPWSRQRLNDSC